MEKAILILTLLATGLCFADTTWVSDTVSGVWTSSGNPYIVTADCYVADGESLFIGEGVRIVSEDTISLVIHAGGRLIAEGSPSFPVSICGVTLDHAYSINYGVIESCVVGIVSPLKMMYTEIRYCETGCYVQGIIYIQFCNIHHCNVGTSCGDGTELYLTRCLLHHNNHGSYSNPDDDGYFVWSKTYIDYCTYANNVYSLFGETEEIWISPTIYSTLSSKFYVTNSIFTDLTNGYGSFRYSYYPEPLSDNFTFDPCFRDTASWDYSLDSTSPYIDLGRSYDIVGGYNGYRPDLGALESPYTAPARCIFYPTDYDAVFPSVLYGDTSFFSIKLYNIGTVGADSIKVDIDPPFYFSGITDSSLPVLSNTYITFGYLMDGYTLEDTATLTWFANDFSGTLLFFLEGTGITLVTGTISGTLAVDNSPYLVTDVTVLCGEELFIEPGVEIGMVGNMLIKGRLNAVGNLTDTIEFTGEGSIIVSKDTLCEPDSSFFDYCRFEGTRIHGSDSVTVSIKHSRLTNAVWVLDFREHTTLTLDSCQIDGNSSIGGQYLCFFLNSKIEINNCIFSDNTTFSYCASYGPYGRCEFYGIKPLIVSNHNEISINGCLFKENWAVDYYCGSVLADMIWVAGNIFIKNTVFQNNHADYDSYYPAFTALGVSGEAVLDNCIFKQCSSYSRGENVIQNEEGLVYLMNCDFFGSGIWTESPGSTWVLNSLFSNSPLNIGVNIFYNCLLPPGYEVSDSSSVIFGTPTFASDTSYMLLPTSIGIDMGAEFAVTDYGDTIWAPTTDYYDNPRPSGTDFDIGAHEYQWDTYTANIYCGVGWNLVSCPVADSLDVIEIFPFAAGPAFSYDNSSGAYLDSYTMFPGVGYWALSSDTSSIELSAGLLDSVTIEIHRGWNLIGTLGFSISVSQLTDILFVVPPIYGYDAASGNYFVTPALLPGRGYWVLSEIDMSITLRRE